MEYQKYKKPEFWYLAPLRGKLDPKKGKLSAMFDFYVWHLKSTYFFTPNSMARSDFRFYPFLPL